MAKEEACTICNTVIYGETYEEWGFNFIMHTCTE